MPTLCHPASVFSAPPSRRPCRRPTLLLNEESIFQMRISVMLLALDMKTFLTIVWRSNELKVEAEAAENSNKVGALKEI